MISKYIKPSAAFSAVAVLIAGGGLAQLAPTNPNPGGGGGPYSPPGGSSCSCPPPNTCPSFTSTDTKTDSVYFNMNLGRASFARKFNYFRAGAAPATALKPSFRLFAQKPYVREFPASLDFYKQSTTTARRNYQLYLSEENIVSTSFLSSSLTADSEAGGETLYDASGAVRQILTDDVFADIQQISSVWSTLPSDIKAVVPSTASGFVVQTWFADGISPTGGPLHGLPSTDRLGYYVFFNPDASLGTTRHLEVIQKVQYGAASSSYKNKTWLFEQNTTTHNWVTKQYPSIPSSPASTLPLEETDLNVSSWTSANAFVQTRTVKQLPYNPDGTFGTSLITVSVDQETYSDVGGLSRLTKKIQGFGGSAPRTTQYGYYSSPTDSFTYGRLKWQSNPDASFEYNDYSGFDAAGSTGTILKYTPARNYKWTPGAAPPVASQCQIEVTNLTQTSSDSTTTLDGVVIAHRSESTTNDGTTSIVTEKVSTESSSANALVTTTGYYYDATFTPEQSNKIKWRELPDGTAEVYSYVTNSSGGTTDTIYKGAGDRTGVTQGTKVVQQRNRRGEITKETTYYLNGGGAAQIQMSGWEADTFDNFGRVLHRIWNGDTTDTETFAYNCCGLTSYTDRKGIVSDYTRDDLQRVSNTKVTSGSWKVENQTTYHEAAAGGLITTESKKGTLGASTLTVLVRETRYGVNGEITQISTPDQNNDGIPEVTSYSYAYATDSSPPASGDGRVVTATYPDGGTVITSYMVDGRKHTVGGTAVPDESYSYLTYSSSGGFYTGTGLLVTHTKLSASGGTAEYEDRYYDRAGRILKVGVPNHAGSGSAEYSQWAYYPSSAAAGQRGKLMTSTDADGVSTSYTYDATGVQNSVSNSTPSGAIRTSSSVISAIASISTPSNTAALGGPAYQIMSSISDGTLTAVNEVKLIGGYERSNRVSSFNQVKTTFIAIGTIGGSWTETSTDPSSASTYSREVSEYVNGQLSSRTEKDASGNVLSGESYSYDPLGRVSSKQDLRTGTGGQINYTYTEAGEVLSVQEFSGRGTVCTRDVMGRVVTKDSFDASNHSMAQATCYSYYPTNLIKAEWAKQTYPIFYIYDEQNRMVEMRTYQSLDTATEPISTTSGYASTAWAYDPGRGWLNVKTDAASHNVTYTYTAGGRPSTITGSRGYVTTNAYTAGYLTSRSYSSTSNTPNVIYTYDGFGRSLNVTQVDQATSKIQSMYDYHYSLSNFQMDYETASYLEQPTAGTFALVRRIDHLTDGLDRHAGVDIASGSPSTIETSSSITYSSTTGRIDTISGSAMGSFTYSYVPNSDLLSKIGTGLFSRSYSYDPARDLITDVENKIGTTTTVSKFTYINNDLAQRGSVTTSGTAFSGSGDWVWGYNDRGELKSADSSLSAFDRAYQYDGIGNRQKSVEGSLTLPGTNNYAANSINQYTVVASGTAPTYDADGNEISGTVTPVYASATAGTMVWDAENRLISVTSYGSTIKFYYDAFGRRIAKQIPNGADGIRYGYLYDDWRVIGQYYLGTPTTVSVQPNFYNMWGPDLSGSWTRTDGVGGLLAVRGGSLGKTYDVAYDANGNITEYVKIDGSSLSVGAHFEYDAFGRALKDSDSSLQFEFRYSTKPIDWNTGLVYYGYRWYDPSYGRFIGRDPMGEGGDLNLYEFAQNQPTSYLDIRGLAYWKPVPYYPDYEYHFDYGHGKGDPDHLQFRLKKHQRQFKRRGYKDRTQRHHSSGVIDQDVPQGVLDAAADKKWGPIRPAPFVSTPDYAPPLIYNPPLVIDPPIIFDPPAPAIITDGEGIPMIPDSSPAETIPAEPIGPIDPPPHIDPDEPKDPLFPFNNDPPNPAMQGMSLPILAVICAWEADLGEMFMVVARAAKDSQPSLPPNFVPAY